jgi:hypothetical protein
MNTYAHDLLLYENCKSYGAIINYLSSIENDLISEEILKRKQFYIAIWKYLGENPRTITTEEYNNLQNELKNIETKVNSGGQVNITEIFSISYVGGDGGKKCKKCKKTRRKKKKKQGKSRKCRK